MQFPGRNEPARAELEQLLKSMGRWDEVADLSLHELEKVLLEARWPPDLLEQLRRFVTRQPTTTLRVTRTEE